jgi:hypothetical protein
MNIRTTIQQFPLYISAFIDDACFNTFTCRGDYRRGLHWWTDLLTIYTYESELQAVTAPPLIPTTHKPSQHPLSLFPACCVFTRRSLATASKSGDSSASRAQVLCSQPPVQNSTKLIARTVLVINSRHGPHTSRKHQNTVLLLLRSCPLPRERVYRAVAQARPRRGPQKTPFFYCSVRYLVTAAVYRVTA